MAFPCNGDGAERRRNNRYSVQAVAKIEPLNHEDTEVQPVTVVIQDVGLTGMLLKLDRPVAVGSSWRLCLFDNQRMLTSVPIVIRFCAPESPGRYRSGVQVMLDPFFLTWLGIPQRELAVDELATEDRFTMAQV